MIRPTRKTLVDSAKMILRRPADILLQSAGVLRNRIDERLSESTAILENPSLSAKFYPVFANVHSYLIKSNEDQPPMVIDGLPVPPPELMEGFGDGDAESYVQSSRTDIGIMKEIVGRAGFDFSKKRILDFGCAGGRLIRQFAPYAEEGDIRGVDISARHIAWCQRHLSPPFRFTTTTTLPHLPFEDNHFDLIYAGSVFTHVSDLADTWLMELRRVLKPGGILYATVHDDHCIEVLEKQRPNYFLTKIVLAFEKLTPFRGTAYDFACIARNPKDAMLFYSESYLKKAWSKEFEILSYNYECYGYQSAVLLRKPRTV